MPRVSCRCGNVISITRDYIPEAFRIVSQTKHMKDYEAVCQALDRGAPVDDLFYKQQLSVDGTLQAYECQVCGRWMLQRRASDAEVILWLLPERDDNGDAPRRIVDVLKDPIKPIGPQK